LSETPLLDAKTSLNKMIDVIQGLRDYNANMINKLEEQPKKILEAIDILEENKNSLIKNIGNNEEEIKTIKSKISQSEQEILKLKEENEDLTKQRQELSSRIEQLRDH